MIGMIEVVNGSFVEPKHEEDRWNKKKIAIFKKATPLISELQ
jgi:hypothetical protein